MTDITIPPEALEAAARGVAEQLGDDWDDNVHTFCGDDFQMMPDGAKEACRDIARAACLAMLKAWPGMDTGPNIYGRQDAIIHLPLTENTNDKG